MKHILKYICILSFVVCFFPLVVFAEDDTYYVLDGCLSSTSQNGRYYTVLSSTYGSDIRVLRLGNVWSECDYFFVSENPFNYYFASRSRPEYTCPYSNPNSYIDASYNSDLGYYVGKTNTSSHAIVSDEDGPVPWVQDDATLAKAVYYTFGVGAVGPGPVINWGILKDVSYHTRIAGNGTAGMRNVDYVNWDNFLDANGNEIDECSVEVQIVPGGWTGSTEQELLAQGLENFNNSSYSPVSVATVNASVGAFSISWQGVCDKLGWNYNSLWAKLENEFWRINGWYYQIRLIAPDGYIGSWQTVYSAMSGSAAGSQNILNSNTFNENLYEYITNLSIANNQQIIEYTINENTYIINNPEYEPDHEPDENGNDYTDILRAIRIAVVNLLNGITELPANIISGFTESIEFNIAENLPEDESFENDIGSALENTYYGDLIVALGNLKAVFDAHRDEIGTSEAGVLHIPELAFDLEGTHVVFIDETDFSLYSWVSDSPELYAWYNRYLLIVDGIIYIMLIRTLFRRMIAHLNGSK